MSLPRGFSVRVAGGVLTADAGHLLVGGSPLTALRLSPRARAMVSAGDLTVADDATAHLIERLIATNLAVPDLTAVPAAPAGELTVVIPVRDRPHQLDRALTALGPLRRIVVDDASAEPDAVGQVVARHGADLVTLHTNVGPAGARNAGLALVTTPYIAFVDSDVEIEATQLLMLTRHFADPNVALVGPRVTGVSRSARPRWFERYDVAASSLSLGRTPGTVQPGGAVTWLPSACLVGRTAALRRGFDPAMRVGEDVDLVWRLVDAGHRVRYDPAIEALHDTRTSVHGWLGRKFVYGTGSAALARRHGDRLAPAALNPAYALAAVMLLYRHRWAVPIAAAAGILGRRAIHRALPSVPGTSELAGRLAARGLFWAVRQEAALALRHWWPVTAALCVRSAGARRALSTALLVDTLVALSDHRKNGDRLRFIDLIAGRRLDDLAYGAGLWWGAMRSGTPRALLTRRPGDGTGSRPPHVPGNQ
jgi:mycofactocin system glycosyltransferase